MMDVGFERFIIPRLYQGGVDIVREHREKGHITVIATAAGEYIAERVRAQLGADDFIATPTPVKGDRMSSEVMGPMAFMEGKLDMAAQYCAGNGAELTDCWFYSDSASDLPLLEAVGHPVMVNPQLKLRAAARDRGWPVLKFKEYARFDTIVRPSHVATPEMDHFLSIYEASL
jgi:phosphoserine phosphatase